VNVSSVDLEKSLRADVESYVSQRTSGLKEELERLRSQLNEALSRMSERLEEPAAEGDAPLAVAVAEHLRNARNLGIETAAAESTRARASSDIALIKAAVDELDGQQHAGRHPQRARQPRRGLRPARRLLRREERARDGLARARAWPAPWATTPCASCRSPSSPTRSSARPRARARRGRASRALTPKTTPSTSTSAASRRTAWSPSPLVAREKAVAVLYADSAGQDADAVNLEALETLVRVAGMAVELQGAPPRAGRGRVRAPRRRPFAGPRRAATREEEPRHEESAHEEPRARGRSPRRLRAAARRGRGAARACLRA
jgi:ElaB/YqjD/DUF883 family membrane-anchored ribosome-binding protein